MKRRERALPVSLDTPPVELRVGPMVPLWGDDLLAARLAWGEARRQWLAGRNLDQGQVNRILPSCAPLHVDDAGVVHRLRRAGLTRDDMMLLARRR